MGRLPQRALAACATALIGALACAGVAGAETASFTFTGAEQTFAVPAGVTSLQVTAVGARGGGTAGGLGAVARATLPVTPGQTLFVEVGGTGASGNYNDRLDRPAGGFNGGGNGGFGSIAVRPGDGGGGATDVRASSRSQPSSLGTRLVVAAGGGGVGGEGTPGGAAGAPGETGLLVNGVACTGGRGGSPGTATTGGAGGGHGTIPTTTGADGATGQSGEGGAGGGHDYGGGGGGGGGFFGGGGGGAGAGDVGAATFCKPGGGGGGSSGFAAGATGTSVVADASGVASVTFTWTPATGGPGGPGGGPGGSGTDVVAPRLSLLALTRTVFVAANVGPSAVAAARVGTTVTYRLDEAARVTFTVERAAPGIRSRGRCVRRPRRPVAGARGCTRWVVVAGSFGQDARAGANGIRFMGRLRGRSLAAGSYRLVATARDAAGNATRRPARRAFRIVAG